MALARSPSSTLEATEGGGSALTGRWAAVALVVVVVVVYLPSLGGGFLNLDCPWLVEENEIVRRGVGGLSAIWLDLSRETRLVLGAEYLPIRDTTHWIEHHVAGLGPRPTRIANLVIYLGAVLLFRGTLKRALGGGVAPEVAAWLFAVHPVHVESVAWVAGRKDVLALLFVAAALRAHAGESRWRPFVVPALLLCAVLSKSMAVAAMGLLWAVDLLARRRPDPRVYVPAAVVLALAMLVHVHVGGLVGIVSTPLGGSRWSAAAAMGRVWLEYLGSVFVPTSLSIVRDAPEVTSWSLVAVTGWALLLVWAALGARLAATRGSTEGRPVVLAAFVWFFVPLLPVSQVFVPLQNFSADRYLFLSVMGPALLVAALMEGMGDRKALGGTLVLAGGLALFTLQRADLFADSVKVFTDARDKTERAPLATYQLGQALEALGEDERAIRAYADTLERSPQPTEEARRATNNLGKLHARHGRLAKAEKVLARGAKLWPRDAQIAFNLAEVLARQPSRAREGAAHYRDALIRFPSHAPGRDAFEARYGSGATPPADVP